MRPAILRSLLVVVLLGLAADPGAGSPADPAGAASIRLTAPRPEFRPAGEGARVVPRIAGFGLSSRTGEPMLPLKVFLVAIPEGSVPDLGVLAARSETIEGIDVAPVPKIHVRQRLPEGAALFERGRRAGDRGGAGDAADAPDYDAEFAADPRIFGRAGEFPASPVRLGSIGYMREQRYVEVIFMPVLFDPGRRRARYFPDVTAEVRFTVPGSPSSPNLVRPFRPDPLFEETYRKSLVNYEQGKMFRVGPGEGPRAATPGAADSLSVAPTTAAASGVPRYKVLVSAAGIYRLDYGYLSAHAPDLVASDARTFMLRAEGVEIPISIRTVTGASAEGDPSFVQGDFLEFFGRPKTEPQMVKNYSTPDIFQANDFTDTQVYWLSAEGSPGSHLRIPWVNGSPVNSGFPIASDFGDTAVWEENNIYLPLGVDLDPNVVAATGDVNPFFSMPSLLAGGTQATRNLSMSVPGISRVSATAAVSIRLRGASDIVTANPDHRTVAWINNDTADQADSRWDGEIIKTVPLGVPQSILTDPTTVHLSAPGITGVSFDWQFPDKVTIQYRRVFTALGEVLAFTYPNQNTRFQVAGFAGTGPTIYDVSRSRPGGEADPVLITQATAIGSPATYTFDVPQDVSAGAPAVRSFYVASSASVSGAVGVRQPDAMVPAAAPVLQDPQNAADIIVIGSRDTIDDTTGGALDTLLTHRLTTQGLTSKVVYVDQIYDEFSFGQRSVTALRSFLAYAFDNWKGASGTARPPSFVLLVGDATPDYKHTLPPPPDGFVWIDQVPTPMMFLVNSILGYYSSDNWIASFRGTDQIPDVFLGRISTRTALDSAAVFDKIRRYEESPPPGLWKGHAVLVAGDGKNGDLVEAGTFEAVQTGLATTYFSSAPYSVPSPPLYFAEPPWNGTDAGGFKTALVSQINGGAAVLSYVGHGSFDVWGSNTFFTTQDATGLANGSLLPFMVNVNCLSGGFHYFVDTGALGEGMTNNPNGGAIATFAPSGLSNAAVSLTIGDELFATLFGPQRERVLGAAAQAVRAALWQEGLIVDLQSYTFLGDPASQLATPAPPPPGGLTASAGNAQVTLAWTPPAVTVAGYRIYRAAADPANPGAPLSYAVASCDFTSSTSCVDRSVVNATTYYYYAVSVDAEGFSGRASNFNTDCATGGPDCVSARPLNPGAPAVPTGLTVVDPGSGGRLVVSWIPNTETDLKSYTLYYGTVPSGSVPGQYTAKVTAAAAATSITLTGLTDSLRYYMALSATNTSGHESPPSAETSGVPHLFQGITPPRAISDLMVSRSGNDLVLSWSRPVVDIYGRPTTVVRYSVYRGATPGFLPFAGPPLATIGDGSITSYTDTGAAASPSSLYYIVTATDASGLVSGAGRELPYGIGDLQVASTGPGTVRLTWSAVTTDVQGLATLVDHYRVYMDSRPVARDSLDPSTLVLDNVRALSVDLPVPSGPLFFSIIVVDDRGNLSPF